MIESDTKSLAKEYLKNTGLPYKKINIPCPPKNTDASDYITDIIANSENHTVFSFETGRYLIKSFALIQNKKDIVIEGNNSVFIQYYDSRNYGENCSDLFHVENCENIVIRNLIVESSSPTHLTGVVTKVADDYMDIAVNPETPVVGDEHFHVGYSHAPERYSTYAIARTSKFNTEKHAMVGGEIPTTNPLTASLEREVTGANKLRLKNIFKGENGNPVEDKKDFEKGMLFSLRYNYYGPVAFVFRNTKEALIEDVQIRSFGGFCFLILPRCADFTFNRLEIVPKDPDVNFFSANADGINTAGLGGKLVIKNSVFRNLGDDILNVHAQIMTAASVDDNSVKITYEKKIPYISPYWAQAGDVLHIFDRETFKRKQDIVIKDYKNETFTFEGNCDIKENDYIVNDSYRPDVLVENCVSYNLRDRAYIAGGAKKLLVKNCEFYNVTGCALYLSTAFGGWLEGAQVEDVEFCNNLVSGCPTWSNDNYAAVCALVKSAVNTIASEGEVDTLHKNINIHDNVFENISGGIVKISFADKVTVKDNVIAHCTYAKEKIKFTNCTNCISENNIIKD